MGGGGGVIGRYHGSVLAGEESKSQKLFLSSYRKLDHENEVLRQRLPNPLVLVL